MAPQGPLDVLAHQWRTVVAARLERRDHLGGGRRVAQGHRDIARPALVTDPVDRRSAHAMLELLPAPPKELGAVRASHARIGDLPDRRSAHAMLELLPAPPKELGERSRIE